MNNYKKLSHYINGEIMNKKVYLEQEDLVTFLEYLLGHIEECYYKECKNSITRFLERNNIKE